MPTMEPQSNFGVILYTDAHTTSHIHVYCLMYCLVRDTIALCVCNIMLTHMHTCISNNYTRTIVCSSLAGQKLNVNLLYASREGLAMTLSVF